MRDHLAGLLDDFRRYGRAVAVVRYQGNRRRVTTYGEIARLAGRFAALLVQRGIGPGDRVLLWAGNSAEWIAAFHGCLLVASTQLPAAVYNANDQLTQWGSTAMTYDLNGSALNDGSNSYVWDARNRLVSADGTGAAFSYDPLGRRVSKTVLSTTTNFLYDGANAVQESGTNPTANLLTGGVDERFQRTSSTETDDYLTDALGSNVELTDSTGASQVQYSYSPFGSQSATGATTTNSYTYTGREFDGLGINYYRARYYNPTTGRFLSEDPLGFAGGINKYAYAGDSPTNFGDPSGMKIGVSGDYMDYSTAISYLEGSPIAAGIIQQLENSREPLNNTLIPMNLAGE